MAQDLRALELKAAPPSISPPTMNGYRPPREKTIIQPPKRPQMPLPRYLEQAQTSSPSNPPGKAQPQPKKSQPAAPADLPTLKAQVADKAATPIDTEGPTRPLGSPSSQGETKPHQAITPQRPFWKKFFKR